MNILVVFKEYDDTKNLKNQYISYKLKKYKNCDKWKSFRIQYFCMAPRLVISKQTLIIFDYTLTHTIHVARIYIQS